MTCCAMRTGVGVGLKPGRACGESTRRETTPEGASATASCKNSSRLELAAPGMSQWPQITPANLPPPLGMTRYAGTVSPLEPVYVMSWTVTPSCSLTDICLKLSGASRSYEKCAPVSEFADCA